MARLMRYIFPEGALLYCRSCLDLQPHKTKDSSYIGCLTCGRTINVVEVVVTYSADEYQNPAPILLPWRLLPPREKAFRLRYAGDLTPVSGEYKLKDIDRATLSGEVGETGDS